MRNHWKLLSLLLTSCASASLSDHRQIEEYPLRSATKLENASLKRCLRNIEASQKEEIGRNGKYYLKTKEIPIGRECLDFLIGMRSNGKKYEVVAQFNDSDTTVRWSLNDQGIIEEHMEDEDDGELDF